MWERWSRLGTVIGATVDASVSAQGESLLCTTPGWAANATQTAHLEVSLNGQQYSADGVTFGFFTPPTFAPPTEAYAPVAPGPNRGGNLGALYPLSGPTVRRPSLRPSPAPFCTWHRRLLCPQAPLLCPQAHPPSSPAISHPLTLTCT